VAAVYLLALLRHPVFLVAVTVGYEGASLSGRGKGLGLGGGDLDTSPLADGVIPALVLIRLLGGGPDPMGVGGSVVA
jgi:hypothetical protein